MRVYLSGSIKDDPDHVKKFAGHEEDLIENAPGWDYVEVVNPLTLDHAPDATYADYMRVDVQALLTCEAIAMIPGWEISQGAKLEFMVATACGLQVIYL